MPEAGSPLESRESASGYITLDDMDGTAGSRSVASETADAVVEVDTVAAGHPDNAVVPAVQGREGVFVGEGEEESEVVAIVVEGCVTYATLEEGEMVPVVATGGKLPGGAAAASCRKGTAEEKKLFLKARERAKKAKERAKQFGREQNTLFIGAWGLMVGWAAADVIIVVMAEYFDDMRSFEHNPLVFAAVFSLIVAALVVGVAERWFPQAYVNKGSFDARLIVLSSHAAGVMLGRSWNEAIRTDMPKVVGWQSLYAGAITVAAVVLARLSPSSDLRSPMVALVHKTTSMMVAWAWADASTYGFIEWVGDGDRIVWHTFCYAIGITIAAAVVCAAFNHVSPLAVTMFGMTCGVAWKRAFAQLLQNESWAPVKTAPDTISEVLWLLLFAVVVTVCMTFLTLALKNRAGNASATKSERSFYSNTLSLAVLTAALNVGWGWAYMFTGLYNMVFPESFAYTATGQSVYLVLLVCAATVVVYIHGRHGGDKALAPVGTNAAHIG
ncbi:hypothetical protein DIPPA_15519 [Diplonema papillatum]|nr:hypothetical protein DIPPA_15519 [Diplonema papillatum]